MPQQLKNKKIFFIILTLIIAAIFSIGEWLIYHKMYQPQKQLKVNITPEENKVIQEKVNKDSEYLKIFANDYNMYLDLGNLEASRGNLEQAVQYYKHAWELIPNNSTPLLNIGNLYIQAGDYQKAEEAFLKARQANPSYYFVYFNLAKLYHDFLTVKADQIKGIYLEGLKNTDNDYQLLQPFCEYLVEQGDYADALKYFNILVQVVPDASSRQQVLQRINEVQQLTK